MTDAYDDLARGLFADCGWGDPTEENIEQLSIRLGAFAEMIRRGSNFPPAIPEKIVDPEAIPDLLAENYQPLKARGEALEAAADRWREQHPRGITERSDLDHTADFLRQVEAYAGTTSGSNGTVEEARQKVKRALLDAETAVDAWFGAIREDLRNFREEAGKAQTEFMQQAGIDKSVSMGGTTTYLRTQWHFEVVDFPALVKAVAEGKAPLGLLAPHATNIRSAIGSKLAPLRECPGMKIVETTAAVRTGRTS